MSSRPLSGAVTLLQKHKQRKGRCTTKVENGAGQETFDWRDEQTRQQLLNTEPQILWVGCAQEGAGLCHHHFRVVNMQTSSDLFAHAAQSSLWLLVSKRSHHVTSRHLTYPLRRRVILHDPGGAVDVGVGREYRQSSRRGRQGRVE